jgi:hypothetical protein
MRAPEIIRLVVTRMHWTCSSSCIDCVFHLFLDHEPLNPRIYMLLIILHLGFLTQKMIANAAFLDI